MPVAPPRPSSLPLNALRAFEAAARLGSFVAAAQELGVTPGAVAAHLKGLEAEIGAKLFERRNKGIVATALAARLLPEFVAAFDALGAAAQAMRREAAPQEVHIAALPAVAQLWLSPRLPALRKAAPDIAISITALEAPPNLKRVPFDLSIFYRPSGEGQVVDEDVIFPVCAPDVAKALRTPADLREAVCLTDAVWAGEWTDWWKKAAPGQSFAPRGPVFSLYALAVAEAVNGAGVLMGHEALIRAELKSGRLVAPFDLRVPLKRALTVTASGRPKKGSATERVMALLKAQAP
ncbi:MAG: LysR family transcriptional regulator [Hyphomicrobiales bacterium]|nr:MAG: LysR family transcriptional regulator [Hyphomicrobiales bacterium]